MDKVKLYIDGGLGSADGYQSLPLDPGKSITGYSSGIRVNHIVIERFFERLRDPTTFLLELRYLAADDAELYLFSMDHDAVFAFANQSQQNAEKAFGKTHSERWMRNYSILEIIDLFADYGWIHAGTFDNIDNFDPQYPHHRLKFRISRSQAPWEYALHNLILNAQDKVIEVGPGNFPWPRADVFLEHISRRGHPAYQSGVLPKEDKLIWGDIQTHNERITDKQYDFALCSHVFEHLSDPKAAAEELSRIAKRGIVIVPSAYKESITCWDEKEHLWECYPSRSPSTLRMLKREWSYINNFRDVHVRTAMTRLFHGDDMSTNDMRKAKKWFRTNEKLMDVIVPWEGKFTVEIL